MKQCEMASFVSPVRVALVHEMLVKLGGAERVLAVLQEMFPEAPIFTLLYDQKKCGSVFPPGKVRTPTLQKWLNRGVPRQLLVGFMPAAVESFDFSEFDVVISSSSAFAHGILTPLSTKHICYCHAPMRYAWDYTHEYLEEKTRGPFGLFLRPFLFRLLHRLRLWDASAADRADLILANSQTTAKRIEKYWRQKSSVLFPPVNLERFTVSRKHEDFFLIVSALTGFKRLDIALEAFHHLPKHRLVVVGEGAERARLESLASSNVQFLGYQSDTAVAKLLQNCRALVFPGLEDFGIVPVEAMACGKPVIAYGHGGVAETVIPGKTGVFFSELNPASFEKAFLDFLQLEEKKAFDPEECRKQAEKFSTEAFAEGLKKVIANISQKAF